MAKDCHKCAHFSAEAFPMCSAPQRDGQRIVLAYLSRSGLYTKDCGPAGTWHSPARPSLLYRITQFLRGAA